MYELDKLATMKRLSRGRSLTAQPVTTNNSKSENEGKRLASVKKDGLHIPQSLSIPSSRKSVELHLQTKKLSNYRFGKEESIAVPHQTSPGHTKRVEGSPPMRFFQRSSSPASSTITRTRKSSFSSSSTLFESSNTVPITIVVTTPTEEYPPEIEGDSAESYFPGPTFRKFRNDSTMSLPAFQTTFGLDRNRLMPPINAQIDTRRMRKAREFEDIRHFLIGFLNNKGSQLPGKLRARIMSVYGITFANLDPTAVATFSGEGTDLDEGIVLDLGLQEGATLTDSDHKRILELAFKSVLPVVTPNPAHDVMEARRKRMTMPLPLRTASLYSVDSTYSTHSTSSISSQMNLSTNSKSKQTLDSIMNKRAQRQSTSRYSTLASPTSSPPRSLKSQPPTSSSSFFKRRSLQVQPQGTQRSEPNLILPKPNTTTPIAKERPQSIFRHKTEPDPAKVAHLTPKVPLPAFNQKFSKSRQLKTESSPSLSSLPHKPAVSSHLSRSPLTATFPRPLSLVQERQSASMDLGSSANYSDQEESPTDSPDVLYMKSSWPALPPAVKAPAVKAPAVKAPAVKSPIVKDSIHPASKTFHELKRTTKQIPKPISIPISKPQEPRLSQLPSPMTPTHPQKPTHKALTRSEVSDLEKPFHVLHTRRSSSTLNAVSPLSPTFPPSQIQGSCYESDNSKMVFPSHPAFAPLEKERGPKHEDYPKSSSHSQFPSHSQSQKWGNSISVTVSNKSHSSSKLKKEKKDKEKRGSIFGNLKRSLFGRS